jgi:PAS domain S-box-containing protein
LLQNLSERVRLCYERAAEACEHAEGTLDPDAKADFLAMERRWLLLARSYQFGERLDDFTRTQPIPKPPHPFDPHSILQANGAAIFAKDSDSRMIVSNPACLKLLGKSWSELHGRTDVEWHSDRVQARNVLSNDKVVLEGGQARVNEEPFNTPLGSRVILTTKAPLLNDDGQIVGIVGVATDITERKKREERAEVLQDELHHRLKNVMSLVQAMARQSIKTGDGFTEFEGRLLAYGRSQSLIFANADGVTLHELISVHRAALPVGDQLTVSGPDVALRADFTIEIGIALHELITNSIKYGALGGDGRAELRWYVEHAEGRCYLVLHWNEQHGRLQINASRQGFGHRVLTQSVAQRLNGEAWLEVLPGEVRWKLRFELTTLAG